LALPISRHIASIALFTFVVAAPAPKAFADAPKLGWTDTAELSFVATSGNTETDALGFKDKLQRTWERSLFTLNAGGIRVETTTTDRFAVGPSASNFNVVENSSRSVTAENYYLNGRFDRKITDRFFWFAGAGWDRNTFSGIENRYTGFGGVGNIWLDSDRTKFRTDYAATYTSQEDVLKDPNFNDKFTGARLSTTFLRKLGATSVFSNDFVADENLDDTADFRASMINSVSVSITKKLALKVSLQWLFDNRPSFKEIDLLDTNPTPPPALVKIGTVPFELDKLDSIFTTSLVVNF